MDGFLGFWFGAIEWITIGLVVSITLYNGCIRRSEQTDKRFVAIVLGMLCDLIWHQFTWYPIFTGLGVFYLAMDSTHTEQDDIAAKTISFFASIWTWMIAITAILGIFFMVASALRDRE